MILITDQLARRLEHAQAADDAGCAEAACSLDPCSEATVVSTAGGYLTFCGPNSPLTHAIGVGMNGPVSEEELEEIEEFFQSRDASVTIDITPHTDHDLRSMLCERGYTIAEFLNVLVREVRPDEPKPECPTQAQVRRIQDPRETELHSRTMLTGFMSRPDLTKEELALGRMLLLMPYSRPYLAEMHGEAAGAACLSIRDRTAHCFGDSTLPAYRNGGVHTALICARLADAIQEGCDLALAATQPGSVSQRNYERLGFQIAYSKLTMVL
ncbi:MAG TPA: GNAT family N-acetyltransferase [Bryobacteraceae bacterium]|nr:GNAT family N-acetyltransferase [Bryobacteraceae bacterium]